MEMIGNVWREANSLHWQKGRMPISEKGPSKMQLLREWMAYAAGVFSQSCHGLRAENETEADGTSYSGIFWLQCSLHQQAAPKKLRKLSKAQRAYNPGWIRQCDQSVWSWTQVQRREWTLLPGHHLLHQDSDAQPFPPTSLQNMKLQFPRLQYAQKNWSLIIGMEIILGELK